MKNTEIRNMRGLADVVKIRRVELGWTQAELAELLRVQRQWVIRLETGNPGAEVGKVLKALAALGLSVSVGNEPRITSTRAAPTANLDEIFPRVAIRDPVPTHVPLRKASRKSSRKCR